MLSCTTLTWDMFKEKGLWTYTCSTCVGPRVFAAGSLHISNLVCCALSIPGHSAVDAVCAEGASDIVWEATRQKHHIMIRRVVSGHKIQTEWTETDWNVSCACERLPDKRTYTSCWMELLTQTPQSAEHPPYCHPSRWWRCAQWHNWSQQDSTGVCGNAEVSRRRP